MQATSAPAAHPTLNILHLRTRRTRALTKGLWRRRLIISGRGWRRSSGRGGCSGGWRSLTGLRRRLRLGSGAAHQLHLLICDWMGGLSPPMQLDTACWVLWSSACLAGCKSAPMHLRLPSQVLEQPGRGLTVPEGGAIEDCGASEGRMLMHGPLLSGSHAHQAAGP